MTKYSASLIFLTIASVTCFDYFARHIIFSDRAETQYSSIDLDSAPILFLLVRRFNECGRSVGSVCVFVCVLERESDMIAFSIRKTYLKNEEKSAIKQ